MIPFVCSLAANGAKSAGRGNANETALRHRCARFRVHAHCGPGTLNYQKQAPTRDQADKIVDWYMDGKINIDDLITHAMPLDQINNAFELMHEGKSIRSVVVY